MIILTKIIATISVKLQLMKFSTFFNHLWVYIKPHLGKFIITTLMMVLSAGIQIAQPELLGKITDEVFILNVDARDNSLAIFYSLVLLGLFIAYSVVNFITTANNSYVSTYIIMQLRNKLFDKVMLLPKKYFDDKTTGKILSKITYDVEQIANSTSEVWITLIRDSVTIIGLLVYIFYINWQLSLAIFLIIPVIAFTLKIAAKRMRALSHKLQYSMGHLTHILDENISNHTLVKIYHAQKQEKQKVHEQTKNLRQKTFKISITDSINNSVIYILIGMGLSSSIYVASGPLAMTAGQFIAFFTAFGMLLSPSKNLANLNKPLQRAIAASESIFGLLAEDEEKNIGQTEIKKAVGHIEFKNVSFYYQKNKPILNNINLKIEAGKTVAFVGETGSGKTTLTQLICRFYDPQQGSITLDGQNINSFKLNSLREQIAFVDQKTALFNDSVAGNISFGNNKMSQKTIEKSAEIANASSFINKLDAQFNTIIGEDGLKLSGGQRQRLSIARAVAKNASILILDEATSALDSATEKKVQKAIDIMQKNATTLIIAHRLSTIEKADTIVVLKQGEIIEHGSHKELLAKKGEYYQLYATQFE
jgi:subfamily B ATP-binding cassette protein MsbA